MSESKLLSTAQLRSLGTPLPPAKAITFAPLQVPPGARLAVVVCDRSAILEFSGKSPILRLRMELSIDGGATWGHEKVLENRSVTPAIVYSLWTEVTTNGGVSDNQKTQDCRASIAVPVQQTLVRSEIYAFLVFDSGGNPVSVDAGVSMEFWS